jgi:uncharacterized protein YbaA (DUF1428 family)
MSYVQGFVIPVRPGQKEAYRTMAADAAPIFAEYGATRTVECWGEDVPDGKRTDYRRAVKAEPQEGIVFSWIFWPDKETCDAAAEKLINDERMKPSGEMPFDMQRMIYAGFEVASDSGDGGAFGWIDGMVAPVPSDKRQAFLDHAAYMAPRLREKGALRVVNGWGVDVTDGTTTDFKRAVEAGDGDTVSFGWIEWPDKATHDSGWGALMAEGLMQQNPPVWDGPRAIFGGFVPILDTDHR